MRIYSDGDLIVKEATDPDEADRLRHEASVLQASAHPGIVSVCRFDDDGTAPARLVLWKIDGTLAADVAGVTVEVGAGWAAALATTVADLHDLGVTHGRVAAEHVIIDRAGRPVLCGFGSASSRLAPGAFRSQMTGDIAGLTSLTSSWLRMGGEPSLRHLGRRLDRLLTASRRPPSARDVATAVMAAVPGARLAPPDQSQSHGPQSDESQSDESPSEVVPSKAAPSASGGPRTRRRRATAIAAVALATGCGAFFAIDALGNTGSGRARPAPTGSVPIGIFRLRPSPGSDPVTVLGRWKCGTATPAVLDLHSGWVWVFSAWPSAGAAARGVPIVRVPGAVGIAAERTSPECDRLLAVRPGGRTVTIDLPRAGG